MKYESVRGRFYSITRVVIDGHIFEDRSGGMKS